jgi:hypothetical protein
LNGGELERGPLARASLTVLAEFRTAIRVVALNVAGESSCTRWQGLRGSTPQKVLFRP